MVKKSILIALSVVASAVGSAKDHRLAAAIKTYEDNKQQQAAAVQSSSPGHEVDDSDPVIEIAGSWFTYDSDGAE